MLIIVLSIVEFGFSENGASAYKHNEKYKEAVNVVTFCEIQKLTDFMSEKELNEYIQYTLRLLSDLDIPFRTFDYNLDLSFRGTFVEYRTCMLNICPIGRDATKEQRDFFEVYDKEHHVRLKMIESLQQRFPQLKLTYLIGGQTSFDILPEVGLMRNDNVGNG